MSEEVRVDAIDALQKIDGMGALLANPKPILQLIAEELYRVARNSFDTNASPDGVAWAPLSRKYAAWKSARFPGRGMLRSSGRLIRTVQRGITGNTAYVQEGPLDYAAVHQYGFDGMVTVPAHTRRVKSRSMFAKVGGKRTMQAQGITQVRSFVRHMHIPARPSMGFPVSSQERVAEDIRNLIVDKGNNG
jgi:phage virion morphogenesis protein